jgi:secreted trypsin-like serine protease
MRHKALAAAIAAITLLTLSAAPANAVTDGVPDEEGHPYVGLMVAIDEDGNPLWRCSGTLISPTVYVTAGHCTDDPAVTAELWFQSDLEPDPDLLGYPTEGEVSGTVYTHPEYDPDAFYLHDLGIVVLDEPVYLDEYAELPTLNQLDALAANKGKQTVTFTSVGYGLQQSFPDAAAWKESALKTRMVSYPRLIQINTGFTGEGSLLLSNNANTGGTCFGDSGGPNFLGDTNVLVGVTSFGLNSTCAGTGGVYRIDRADDLEWIQSFL